MPRPSLPKSLRQNLRIGWPAFVVPFLFVFSPSLLMQGDWGGIALAVISASAGIWFVSVGLVGFFRSRLGGVERIWVTAAGLMLLIPADIGRFGLWIEVGGLVLGLIWLWRRYSERAPV